MEYDIAVGETTRLRVSQPRMQVETAKTWSSGDHVAVTVVDLDAVRVFPLESVRRDP